MQRGEPSDDRCVQMFGGTGYIQGHAIERLYRDVRLFRLCEGTSQIHKLNIAKQTIAAAGFCLQVDAGRCRSMQIERLLRVQLLT